MKSEYFRAQPRPLETIFWKKPMASSLRVVIAGVMSVSAMMNQVSQSRAPFFHT